MEFLDYIRTLAAEGETALIVRQKPQLKSGELAFHADGAIVATWPAYMPEHKPREGQAWYGNTGSFILNRFNDGHPSASKNNIEYVLCMMLDDIGTKSKTPPLEPTWKMETSAGNFQWGYAFSEQPTKAAFVAAVNAIAEAGYTDPGASNPVRNFRLPGSVNLKPNANNFVSVLTEFNFDLEYTLEDICKALDVTPHAEQGDGVRTIRLADDGNDDVMRWLSDHGLLLGKPNHAGWAGVICPNSAAHSDGNPEGYYMPSDRAYCCYHSHCKEINSSTFLEWVADNGGPKHSPGLRQELLVQTMDQALSKLKPSAMFVDDAAAVIADAERKQLDRVEKADWWGRFAYIQEDEAFFDMIERREVSRQSFNALFRHIACKSIHNSRRIEASISFDENRQSMGAKALVGVTYAAGAPVIVARNGLLYGNRWRNARPTPVAGDVSLWLRHLERLVPTEFEREHLLNVMAHKLQFPSHKINHAVLMGGNHGSGKDTLFAPFFWAIGGDAKTNCSLVKNEDLNSQWGYALECEIMEIAELRQNEARDRRALENILKPIIAAPPELLPINRKGLHPYMALNRVLVIAFSNERAAISVGSEDRRWFCMWTDAGRLPETQAEALWNSYHHRDGFSAVANLLLKRDVSAWNPSAAPPMTEAKAIMIEHGMSTAESVLVDLLRRRTGDFALGVIASPFHVLCDRLQGHVPPGIKIPQAALFHALREAGWIDMGRIASREYGTRKHIFCAPEMADKSKSDLRRMVA